MARGVLRWRRSPDQLARAVEHYATRVDGQVGQAASTLADLAETTAVRDHPWQNQTGLAEQGLNASFGRLQNGLHRVVLAQLEPERAGLEYWRNGRWGVIRDTMDRVHQVWRVAVQGALR